MAAFEARPNVLQYPVSVSGGGTADVGTVGISVQEFLARKKVGIKAIREVSPIGVNVKASSNHCQF